MDIFDRNYRRYGYRRLHSSLSDRSLRISEKVVRRLMKQEALVAVYTADGGITSICTRSRSRFWLSLTHVRNGRPDALIAEKASFGPRVRPGPKGSRHHRRSAADSGG